MRIHLALPDISKRDDKVGIRTTPCSMYLTNTMLSGYYVAAGINWLFPCRKVQLLSDGLADSVNSVWILMVSSSTSFFQTLRFILYDHRE